MAKKTRPEQLKIAGTERLDRIPAVERCAEEFRDADEQAKAFSEERKHVAERLADLLREHNLTSYVYEDRTGKLQRITLEELDVKVKIKQLRVPRAPEQAEPAERN